MSNILSNSSISVRKRINLCMAIQSQSQLVLAFRLLKWCGLTNAAQIVAVVSVPVSGDRENHTADITDIPAFWPCD